MQATKSDAKAVTYCPFLEQVYRVERYHTGDFIGKILRFEGRDIVVVEVVDPLRSLPKVNARCSFPQCVLEDFHRGEHEFSSIHQGGLVKVYWENARFIKLEGAQA